MSRASPRGSVRTPDFIGTGETRRDRGCRPTSVVCFNTSIVTRLGLARNHTSYVGKTVWRSIEAVGVESVSPLGEETSPLQAGHYISLMGIDPEVLHHVLVQLES